MRRLGFVDVVAIAASSDASARRKADALGVPKAYGSYEALVDDPAVHVVHNTTPNHLHAPVILAAIARGKHVISDKPLAMSAAEAKRLWDAAEKAGVKKGDLILEIAGKAVTAQTMRAVMATQKVNVEIEVKILRNKEELVLKLTPK